MKCRSLDISALARVTKINNSYLHRVLEGGQPISIFFQLNRLFERLLRICEVPTEIVSRAQLALRGRVRRIRLNRVL